MSVGVVIVAAGRGRRLGGALPKQYLPLGAGNVIGTTLAAFQNHPSIDRIVTVIHPDDMALYRACVLDEAKLLAPVMGGETRGGSVRRGLEALGDLSPDHVLIHDAARPFVTARIIDDVIDALGSTHGACAAVKVVDAMWDTGSVPPVSVPRDNLWRAQTPQGFHFPTILAAHQDAKGEATDDVAVAVAAGMAVTFVPGAEGNYKITTADDYARAQRDCGPVAD